MRFTNKKGQNTAEYAILIALVIAAAIGIQTYVKRGLQGRLKTEADGIVGSIKDNWDDTAFNTITVTASPQYEPENFTRKSTSNVQEDSESFVSEVGGATTRGFDRRSTPTNEDYQKQGY